MKINRWLVTILFSLFFGVLTKNVFAANLSVSIRATNSNFVVAEGGGCSGSVVNANRVQARGWETFTLIDKDNGPLQTGHHIHLKTIKGCFVVAEEGGGQPLRADREIPALWETFIIEKVGGGSANIVAGDGFALKTFDGKFYVSAQNCGGSSVIANATSLGICEIFSLQLAGDGIASPARLSGPFQHASAFDLGPLVDQDRQKGSSDLDCKNYTGEGTPFCYDQHEGMDFPVKLGFGAMNSPKFLEISEVLAAAPGYVVSIEESKGDRCYSRPSSSDPSKPEIFCPEEGQKPKRDQNFVAIRQDDGLLAYYLHCQRNTIPWDVGDRVECGDTICRAGSSGDSSGPHLHFELRKLDKATMDALISPTDFKLFSVRPKSTITDPFKDTLWWMLDARRVPQPVCGSHGNGLCEKQITEVRCDLSTPGGRACGASGGRPASACQNLCKTLTYNHKEACPPPAPPPPPPPPPPCVCPLWKPCFFDSHGSCVSNVRRDNCNRIPSGQCVFPCFEDGNRTCKIDVPLGSNQSCPLVCP